MEDIRRPPETHADTGNLDPHMAKSEGLFAAVGGMAVILANTGADVIRSTRRKVVKMGHDFLDLLGQ